MKYAYFDSTAVQPAPVLGWYDTDSRTYANLPAASDLLELTQAEWDSRLTTPYVDNGALVAEPAPTAAQQLAAAQAAQVIVIDTAYYAAIQQSVSFTTAGGVTKTFQADAASQQILSRAVQGYDLAGAAPSGFYWLAEDNTEVPFTLADLKGLYAAMLDQGWTNFQHRATQKAAIRAATTIANVQAVVW